MPLPVNVAHYIVSGTNPGGEAFAFGWWVDYTNATDVSSDLDASTAWVTFRNALTALMAPSQHITDYDVYQYASGSLTGHQNTHVDHAGTDSTGLLPLQVTLVLTTRSATLTRSGRGRMYLPVNGLGALVTNTGLYSGTQVQNFVNFLAAFFTSEAAAGRVPSVVSRQHGTRATITSVDADVIPDTQRRRRDKLTAARVSAAVTS